MGTHAKAFKQPSRMEQLTDLYLLLMLTLFPLYTGFQGYLAISNAKYVCFLLFTVGYLLLLPVFGIMELSFNKSLFPGLKAFWKTVSPRQALVALFLIFVLLSTLCSSYQDTVWLGSASREGFLSLFLYGALFLALSAFGRVKRWMLYAFGISVSLVCIVALLQYAGFNPLWLFPTGDSYHTTRIFMGTIGNIDLLSAFLCIAIPALSVGGVLLHRPLLFLPAVLGVAVLALSGVAAGAVGLILGCLLLFPVVISRKNPHLLKFAVIAVAAAVIVGAVFIYFFPWPPESTLYEISQVLHGNFSPEFGSSRIAIWRESLTLVPEHPLLGGGPDTLAQRLNMVFESGGRTSLVTNAHNLYLDLLVNIGLPGTLAFGTALLASIWRGLRFREHPVALILLGAVLCYSIQALFSFSSCITAPFFWIAWGLLERQLKLYSKKGEALS